jgi:predicted AlkP superfamily pyrophosphatase or phosphodiesterase
MLKSLAWVVLFLAVAADTAVAAERHIVLILIDGLPAYLLDDPQASLPVIRGLAKKGVAAEAGMRVSNPSITWPNCTSVVTGSHPDRHGVLTNGRLKRRGPGQVVEYFESASQQELVRVPLLFDVLKKAGQTSAAINWPCTAGSTSIDDNFPDVPNALAFTTPRLMEELRRNGLLARFEAGNDVVQDEIRTEAACQIIRNRMPRFLALHLSNVDTAHHDYGPRSAPGYTAAALNDANIGRVLQALDEARFRDRTAIFVVADHGFVAAAKSLRPNAILRREGLLTVKSGRIVSSRVLAVPTGGTAMVYLTDSATAPSDRQTVLRLFSAAEGIASLIEPKDYSRYHLPQPGDDPAMGDLVLAAKEGYVFSLEAAGDDLVVANPNPNSGSHGFLSTEPKMNAIFVASGAGIKAGTTITGVENIDVAPTVARLLGVPLENAAGRVLEEALRDPTQTR